jgi:serine/threonine protein kinase
MSNCPQCAKNFSECQCATRMVSGLSEVSAEGNLGLERDHTVERDPAVANAPTVPGYEHLKLLGRGASSAVFLSEKLSMAKLVAVKVLYQSHLTDQRAVKRFELEARALSNLSHPNIVSVFDIGFANDHTPFIAMEFADGVDLKELILQDGILKPDRAIKIFSQLCDALAYAHEHNIVHRDLKPSNVVIVRDWNGDELVKLVDFGIAKPTTDGGEIQRLTQTGELLGSPAYMSPEQIRSADADPRSDIYSLGCVMYEALTGRPPFRGESIIKTLTMHLEDPVAPVGQVNPQIAESKQLCSVIESCLAKNADERPQSARELKTSIASLLPSERRSGNRTVGILLSGVVVLLLVTTIFFASKQNLVSMVSNDAQNSSAGNGLNRKAQNETDTAVSSSSPRVMPAQPGDNESSSSTTSEPKVGFELLNQLAKAELMWYTGLTDASRDAYEDAFNTGLAEKAPVKTQLALCVHLMSERPDLASKTSLYNRMKPQIDAVVKEGSNGVESLFVSYILWYLGDAESAQAQEVRASDRSKSDSLAALSLKHLEASLFLAKRRNNADAHGLLAHVSKDLGIIHAFRGDLKAARENYKRSFDAFLETMGPKDSNTIEVAKLLARTSLALFRRDAALNTNANKAPAYLQTTHEALAVLAKANPEDSELRELMKSIEQLH